jgi:hypothetical protein
LLGSQAQAVRWASAERKYISRAHSAFLYSSLHDAATKCIDADALLLVTAADGPRHLAAVRRRQAVPILEFPNGGSSLKAVALAPDGDDDLSDLAKADVWYWPLPIPGAPAPLHPGRWS